MEFPQERIDGAANFNTTHWTIVLACGDETDSDRAQQALASLFQTYWYPLYAYVRRRGYDEHDAKDLVQGFCLHLQEKHAVAKADRQRGKFRTFLLSSLQNFIGHEYERSRAQKRGGGQELIRLDAEEADARYRLEPVHSATPETIFEKRWANALLEQTVSGLRADFVTRGKERLFDGSPPSSLRIRRRLLISQRPINLVSRSAQSKPRCTASGAIIEQNFAKKLAAPSLVRTRSTTSYFTCAKFWPRRPNNPCVARDARPSLRQRPSVVFVLSVCSMPRCRASYLRTPENFNTI